MTIKFISLNNKLYQSDIKLTLIIDSGASSLNLLLPLKEMWNVNLYEIFQGHIAVLRHCLMSRDW